MSSVFIVVKFGKRRQAVETVKSGSGLFDALAAEFGVLPDRAKLVFRGRTFTQTEAEEVVSIAENSQKAVFVLLAARSEEQLDHGHSSVRRAASSFYWEWGGRQLEQAWIGVQFCLSMVISVVRIFFATLFTSRGSEHQVGGGEAATGSGRRGGQRDAQVNQGLRRRPAQNRRQGEEGGQEEEAEDLSNTAARENGGTLMSWMASLRRW